MAVRCSPAWQAALWAACCAAVASAAQPLEVRRSSQSLAATPTHLQPADAAPLTQLQPHVTHGGLVPRETETRLQVAAGPATLLRAAEVPPQRLEQTRALLVELQAQPTPEQAISIDLPADVLFDFDKAELRADAARSLDKAAELLKSYPQAPIDVVGHTDGKGGDAYNDALSQRRAAAVAAALQSRTGRPIATRGMGKRQPVAPNTTPDGRDDPDGRQRNRRVQIVIGALPVR
ncbi:OmpA family protein [Diaphorobacter sp. LR2014-1]|uniref:OmpA family protein n=1 Tax=Diaphorobacter sp. LR2014-1 TaxID=1933219 RepID=UPI000CDB4021|nr:OmpA family protein [Diaphorobacter sp. LR2014-1]POR11652.1 flagellar motor protein MotB [Diaphorobacter sp. LR2014-1]QPN32347.1 OmpA family protein [Diaphorobacter sp. JS3051]